MAEQEEDSAGQPAEEVEDWETLYDREEEAARIAEEEAEAAQNAARIAALDGQQGNDGQQGDQVGDGGQVGNQEGEGVPGGQQGVDVLEGDQEEDGGQQVQQLVDEFAEMRAELMESVYVHRVYRKVKDYTGNTLTQVSASGRHIPKPYGSYKLGQRGAEQFEVWQNDLTFLQPQALQRTFDRYKFQPTNERNVSDLTEDIIDPVKQSANLEGLNDADTYGRTAVAFYVCNGTATTLSAHL